MTEPLKKILDNYYTYQKQTKIHNNDIPFLTKNYILHGQGYYTATAYLLNWDEDFLNLLDDKTINKVYEKYLLENNPEGNIRKFAEYLTYNAPIRDNWKEIIKKKVEKKYNNIKVTKIKLESENFPNIYGIYVSIDGKPQQPNTDGIVYPFVFVNIRTGSLYK